MTTRLDIITKAQEYVGTPYLNQGRVKGVGIDCGGLIVCVARDLGLSDFDLDCYPRFGDGKEFLQALRTHAGPELSQPVPCAIGFFMLGMPGKECQPHAGIFGQNPQTNKLTLIHASYPAKRVISHNLHQSWCQQLEHVFDFPS